MQKTVPELSSGALGKLKQELGRGSTSVVYHATCCSQDAAVKVFAPTAFKSALHEAETYQVGY